MEFPTSRQLLLKLSNIKLRRSMYRKQVIQIKYTAILEVMAGDVRIDNHKFKEKFDKKARC